MKKYAIIVAGGVGTRMGSELPKQFLGLNGQPVIFHTIKVFRYAIPGISIIIVLPAEWTEYFERICVENKLAHIQTIVGGARRFESVKNGIDAVADKKCLVALHDAVRPLVSKDVINLVFNTAAKQGNAIPVVPLKDSIRQIKGAAAKAVERSNYAIVQTPQCFQSHILRKAYRQPFRKSFTDSASVVESSGEKINLVEGNEENFKITTPMDLRLAEMLLKQE